MKDWHSEEQIKAQLRELTEQTRKLRNDLYALIRPSKKLSAPGFTHDHAGATAMRPSEGRADDRGLLPRKRE